MFGGDGECAIEPNPTRESVSAEADATVIARRYRGPPDSANGGYACGIVARHLAGPARVRLHLPPPLEQPLAIRTTDAGRVAMLRAEQVVAEGVASEPEGEVPGPVGFDAAVHASREYRWFTGHPFPGCFVCGPERTHGDGLCIFPGRVPGREVVAAPWIPDDSVCDASGLAQPEVVWAALDCPSWFGALEFEPGTRFGLLGQLSARIVRRPAAGERCVSVGWSAGREGRKLFAGAALYTADGALLGRSAAVWIEPQA